jgi:Domain of unknown function (DUF6531)
MTPRTQQIKAALTLTVTLVCLAVCWLSFVDRANGASPQISEDAGSPLVGSLVIPESPLASEQTGASEQANMTSPTSVARREVSRTEFAGLAAPQAAAVAAEAFPKVIDEQAGGPPELPAGQQITSYLSDYVARVALPDGKRGVIESSAPMALEASTEHWQPVDLSLTESGASFAITRPVTQLRIPAHLQEGVRLLRSGVSLTPVNASGTAVGGAPGLLDGAVAFFGGVEVGSDVDVIVKPVAYGFEEDTLLRSARSPETIAFRVGLPQGATLRQAASGSGQVEIVKEGQPIALIQPPFAEDAAGTSVPVSMSTSGETITVALSTAGGEYEYPIRVDPTAIDTESGVGSGWHEYTPYPSEMNYAAQGTSNTFSSSNFTAGHWGEIYYETQGKSQIYAAWLQTAESNHTNFHGTARIQSEKGVEGETVHLPVGGAYTVSESWLCGIHSCAAPEHLEEGRERNGLYFEQEAAKSGGEYSSEALLQAKVYVAQEAGPSVSLDTTHETGTWGGQNPLYGNRWANSGSVSKWEFKANAEDPGTGPYKYRWHSPNDANWDTESKPGFCHGIQCTSPGSDYMYLGGFGFGGSQPLPEGEDTVEVTAEDAVGLTSTVSAKVKVDNVAPHFTLAGLPASHEIGAASYHLKAEATDGSGSPSAGVKWLTASIDGRSLGTSTSCAPGTCTVGSEWSLEGAELSAGKHILRIAAADNANNERSEEITLTSRAPQPLSVGPGAVNPTSGALSLSSTDVAIPAPGAGLSVSRSYLSRGPAPRIAGPLGPQWHVSLGAQESLAKATTPTGAMVLTSANGEQTTFSPSGEGKFTAPTGDAGLILVEKKVGEAKDYVLSENGTATTFAIPTGGGGTVWEPIITEGNGGTNALAFAYKTEGGITEPTQELAPVPSGVSCAPKLNKGCRALSFVYAKTTKATGEGPGEWGDYTTRLKEVTLTAYDSASKEMKTKAVGQYAYDLRGRLRAEWNPQITPSLKTVYGYDSEDHVTSLANPGQQPWLVEQGTTAIDGAPGRVLAVARPPASSTAVLKSELEASVPVNTAVPTLSSTSPVVGKKLSVSTDGTWTNSPLAFSYQWENCNSSGKECVVIPGAVNQSYYPVKSDEGHTLVALVRALNADATVSAPSTATALVATGTPSTPLPEPPPVGTLAVWTIDYQVPLSGSGVPQMSSSEVAKWGQTDVPTEATALFPPDEPMGWPAQDYKHATISYLDVRERAVNVEHPTGGIATTEYNNYNDVTRTLTPDNRVTALAAGEGSKAAAKEMDTESTYKESGAEPGTELLSSLGPKHSVALTSGGAKVEARKHTVYTYNEGAPTEGGPYHLVTTLTQGAQVAGKEEASSVRTTKTAYSGQGNLGWKLRRPTSVTVDPSGLNLRHAMLYDGKTGNVTETRMPAAGTLTEEADNLQLQFGNWVRKHTGSKNPRALL